MQPVKLPVVDRIHQHSNNFVKGCGEQGYRWIKTWWQPWLLVHKQHIFTHTSGLESSHFTIWYLIFFMNKLWRSPNEEIQNLYISCFRQKYWKEWALSGNKCLYKLSLINRFHVAVHLFSKRSWMMSKCGKNKKVANKLLGDCVTDVLTTYWCLLWSIIEQILGNMESTCLI